MSLRNIFTIKTLYVMLIVLVMLFLTLILSSFSRRNESKTQAVISPTPVKNVGRETTLDHVPIVITINPTYTEKIKREPFWLQLPYWTNNYKIEYRDSDDRIRISVFLPQNTPQSQRFALTESYKEQALTWIRANGGNPNTLRFEYKIYE